MSNQPAPQPHGASIQVTPMPPPPDLDGPDDVPVGGFYDTPVVATAAYPLFPSAPLPAGARGAEAHLHECACRERPCRCAISER